MTESAADMGGSENQQGSYYQDIHKTDPRFMEAATFVFASSWNLSNEANAGLGQCRWFGRRAGPRLTKPIVRCKQCPELQMSRSRPCFPLQLGSQSRFFLLGALGLHCECRFDKHLERPNENHPRMMIGFLREENDHKQCTLGGWTLWASDINFTETDRGYIAKSHQ